MEILPKVPLGPNSRHLFKIPETTKFNFVKLNMYPDGGIVSISIYLLIIQFNSGMTATGTLPRLW
jgi:allantoicase